MDRIGGVTLAIGSLYQVPACFIHRVIDRAYKTLNVSRAVGDAGVHRGVTIWRCKLDLLCRKTGNEFTYRLNVMHQVVAGGITGLDWNGGVESQPVAYFERL